MSLVIASRSDAAPRAITIAQQTSGAAFDRSVTALAGLFLAGVFVDGWAHTHGRVDVSFFTPWHAALYSGYLATALLLVARTAWAHARGARWGAAVPAGYGLSLLGAGLWVVGGPFDLLWHSLFGFEASVEALLSPAHAVLALGFGLMASGPLRAALRRVRGRWHDELPLVLALTFVLADLHFFTQIAHPLANLWAAGPSRPSSDATELGIVSMLVTAAINTAPILLFLRLGRLPVGAVSIILGLQCFAVGFVYDHGPYPVWPVVGMIAAAVVADALRAVLRPSDARPAAFRSFAFALPAILCVGYFAALALTAGLSWSTHLWTGTIVFSGIEGWLLSYVVMPPRVAISLSSPAAHGVGR
jgi:hypothetical protein